MLSFINDASVLITGFLLAMIVWYVIGMILFWCFPFAQLIDKLVDKKTPVVLTLIGLLMIVPAMFLFVVVTKQVFRRK